jgi:hypothetical protein
MPSDSAARTPRREVSSGRAPLNYGPQLIFAILAAEIYRQHGGPPAVEDAA